MITRLTIASLALALASIAPASAKTECGKASWYALGGRTASGAIHNPEAMTAAHRTLPFGTQVKVENLANGREVVVKIVDRGPFVRGRVIDLSKGAARELGFISKGVTKVRVTRVADASPVGGSSCQ